MNHALTIARRELRGYFDQPTAYVLIVAFFAFAALQELVIGPMMAPEQEVPYSQFRSELAADEIGKVTVEPERILYTLKQAEGDEEAVETRKVVRIEGSVDRDRVLLRVKDDGVGFDPNAEPSGRYGLVGMRERAKEIGADLDIVSNDGIGTTVTVTWDVQ